MWEQGHIRPWYVRWYLPGERSLVEGGVLRDARVGFAHVGPGVWGDLVGSLGVGCCAASRFDFAPRCGTCRPGWASQEDFAIASAPGQSIEAMRWGVVSGRGCLLWMRAQSLGQLPEMMKQWQVCSGTLPSAPLMLLYVTLDRSTRLCNRHLNGSDGSKFHTARSAGWWLSLVWQDEALTGAHVGCLTWSLLG